MTRLALPISWVRFLAMWLAMAVAMIANGIFRELVLKHILSSTIADVSSAIIGILLIGFIARVGFAHMRQPSAGSLAIASISLVLLTVVFEAILGIFIDHKSTAEILEHYAVWHGQLWPLVLAFLAWTPFLWAQRLRSV